MSAELLQATTNLADLDVESPFLQVGFRDLNLRSLVELLSMSEGSSASYTPTISK